MYRFAMLSVFLLQIIINYPFRTVRMLSRLFPRHFSAGGLTYITFSFHITFLFHHTCHLSSYSYTVPIISDVATGLNFFTQYQRASFSGHLGPILTTFYTYLWMITFTAGNISPTLLTIEKDCPKELIPPYHGFL